MTFAGGWKIKYCYESPATINSDVKMKIMVRLEKKLMIYGKRNVNYLVWRK